MSHIYLLHKPTGQLLAVGHPLPAEGTELAPDDFACGRMGNGRLREVRLLDCERHAPLCWPFISPCTGLWQTHRSDRWPNARCYQR